MPQGNPLTNAGFVTGLYRDVLKREPDQAGLAAWGGLLNSGQVNPAQVAQGFLDSTEYHTDAVQGFYNTLLHRAADPAGLNAGTAFLNQGGSQLQLEAVFLGSDEYYITRGGGSVNGYLEALYQDVLDRPIDPAGLEFGTTFLLSSPGNGSPAGNGTVASRAALASLVINSPEGDVVIIDHLYGQYLHRAPDPAGLNALLAGFQANLDPPGVSGSQATQDDPAQAAIIPAGVDPAGSTSGQTPGITLEQATVLILSSPEYFSLATS